MQLLRMPRTSLMWNCLTNMSVYFFTVYVDERGFISIRYGRMKIYYYNIINKFLQNTPSSPQVNICIIR